MPARGNGFIPDLRPRGDLGVTLNRLPTKLGTFDSTSSGYDAAAGKNVDLARNDGWIEFTGEGASNWSYAYAENPKQFFPIREGLYPSSSVGRILLRRDSDTAGVSLVVTDWPYEPGFVRAMSSGVNVLSDASVPSQSVTRTQVEASTDPDDGANYTPGAGTIFSDYISPNLPSGTANTDTVYIGTTDEDLDTTGVPIPPGGTIRMFGTGTVFFYSPTAGQKIAPVDHKS